MLTTDTISVQLYTVREAIADDLDAALARVAAIGYRLVEPFSLLKFADGLATALPKHGLSAPTTHQALIGQSHEQIFSTAQGLGIGTVIDPHIDEARWASEESIAEIAAELNAAAETGKAYGVNVGYHNHAFELSTTIGDRHGLEVLADHLSDDVVLEVDTYWAYAGGADVPALLRTLGDRVVALHIKDGDGSMDNKKQVAVGAGSLPVWDYVAAATTMKYGVVELDDSAGDRFVAIEDSFAYLSTGN
ncbi:MAG: sugar phosphate isomerase/epimerase family protein [Propionibacteriaceae bacterium]